MHQTSGGEGYVVLSFIELKYLRRNKHERTPPPNTHRSTVPHRRVGGTPRPKRRVLSTSAPNGEPSECGDSEGLTPGLFEPKSHVDRGIAVNQSYKNLSIRRVGQNGESSRRGSSLLKQGHQSSKDTKKFMENRARPTLCIPTNT